MQASNFKILFMCLRFVYLIQWREWGILASGSLASAVSLATNLYILRLIEIHQQMRFEVRENRRFRKTGNAQRPIGIGHDLHRVRRLIKAYIASTVIMLMLYLISLKYFYVGQSDHSTAYTFELLAGFLANIQIIWIALILQEMRIAALPMVNAKVNENVRLPTPPPNIAADASADHLLQRSEHSKYAATEFLVIAKASYISSPDVS